MSKSKITHGAALLAGAQLGKRLLDFTAMIILARLLTPADFGLIALAATMTTIAMAVADLSLSDIVLREDTIEDDQYATIFTLALGRGLAIASLICLAAYPVALVYKDARLLPILCVLSLAPLSRSLISPRMAEYSRALSFKQESMLELGSRFIGLASSIAWAISYRNYWAIAVNQVVSPVLFAAGSYVLAPVTIRLSLKHARSVFAFNIWLTLQRLMNTVNFYVDRLLIVPQLGVRQLGIYTVGSDWAALPTQAAQAPMSRVLYAGMARLHKEPVRLKEAYLAAMEASSTILFPIGVGTSLVAHRLVPVALGLKWASAVVIIAVLAPIFSVQSVTAPAQALAMSSGNTRQLFMRDVTNFLFRVPLVVVGLSLFGLWGLLVARLIAGLNIAGMNFILAKRISGATMTEQLRSMRLAVLGACTMIAAVMTVDSALTSHQNALVLMIDVIVGGASYFLSTLLFWRILGKPKSIIASAVAILQTRVDAVKGSLHAPPV
ncbi:lipopolysaccharide biosynthesis protein [Sphingomonas sp. H39-1-10]|uniref:lipopolysaccharide biosynthesis protein n=1 Tax=Sphingomonas pollutisoli TaxID=3030829 RepID=UPI0023B97689|nr:lipopolysaccharide biosynthesis protein [Sphingomonas pollutisoli]MDF0490997.1 lipopolysaccharide biosynthesis protein [Sphingomonas pollutisoli]